MPYMVTFTINIPQMLVLYHTWILWDFSEPRKIHPTGPGPLGEIARTKSPGYSEALQLPATSPQARAWFGRHFWTTGPTIHVSGEFRIMSDVLWDHITGAILWGDFLGYQNHIIVLESSFGEATMNYPNVLLDLNDLYIFMGPACWNISCLIMGICWEYQLVRDLNLWTHS